MGPDSVHAAQRGMDADASHSRPRRAQARCPGRGSRLYTIAEESAGIATNFVRPVGEPPTASLAASGLILKLPAQIRATRRVGWLGLATAAASAAALGAVLGCTVGGGGFLAPLALPLMVGLATACGVGMMTAVGAYVRQKALKRQLALAYHETWQRSLTASRAEAFRHLRKKSRPHHVPGAAAVPTLLRGRTRRRQAQLTLAP